MCVYCGGASVWSLLKSLTAGWCWGLKLWAALGEGNYRSGVMVVSGFPHLPSHLSAS